MLLKNAITCINTNGHMTPYFKISRSARQGCPILPLIYVLHAEPMACSLRENELIKGIKQLPHNFEAKINIYADDTQLFNSTEQYTVETFSTLEIYEKASGSKMNVDQTEAIYIRKWKGEIPIYDKINWSKTAVITLCSHHGPIVDIDIIWRSKIDNIKAALHVRKTRNLTF